MTVVPGFRRITLVQLPRGTLRPTALERCVVFGPSATAPEPCVRTQTGPRQGSTPTNCFAPCAPHSSACQSHGQDAGVRDGRSRASE
jgi:hypothetical protein